MSKYIFNDQELRLQNIYERILFNTYFEFYFEAFLVIKTKTNF
jgi:hypothetical protein